jgi:predicted amidohydrolase
MSNSFHIGVAIVQWEARGYGSVADFIEEAEACVRSMAVYRPDFLLFPEYFTLCIAEKGHDDAVLLAEVAQHTPMVLAAFQSMAQRYQINIVAGTMPLQEDNKMFNISYLCHRDGRIDAYKKTHLTPFEHGWELSAGDVLPIFETDCGKVGILICYDVEFPEAARKMALEGAKVLFVPYQTDTEQGYFRVRLCAQARAVENECYVVTAGLVGAMPGLSLVEFQFAQSAVFTPSDLFFPVGGVHTACIPNRYSAVFSDLDMQKLQRLHETGSVRTMRDRRLDLY